MAHTFLGTWISNATLADLAPRNVFHKQLTPLPLDCSEHRNCHVLFRRRFTVTEDFRDARIFLSADDYYKLYVNGRFVAQGPAPSYHFQYNYNEVDLTPYLTAGENVIAVHTLYQGLINRVWCSGDDRHGQHNRRCECDRAGRPGSDLLDDDRGAGWDGSKICGIAPCGKVQND